MCPLTICISSLKRCLSKSSFQFVIGLVFFYFLFWAPWTEIASGNLLKYRRLSSVPCDDLEGQEGGGKEAPEGQDVCMHIVHLLHLYSRNEHNTVKQLYPIKKNEVEN